MKTIIQVLSGRWLATVEQPKKYSFTYDEIRKMVNDGYIQGAIDFDDRNMNNAFENLWDKIKKEYNVL